MKAERSEAFTRQQGLQAVVTSATFLGEKGQEGEKEEGKEYEMEEAAKRPARCPKGCAWRVKAERSEAFTSQQTCKR